MKNITLSADDDLIEQARRIAREQHKSLNVAFREWLEGYVANATGSVAEYDRIMRQLRGKVRSNPPYTREEMNER